MYFLPIYIKRYKVNIKAECLVKNIRSNTMYIYDKNGYIKQSNPRALICRNEKDKTIILKDRPFYHRAWGGVTAVMVSDKQIGNQTIVTTIAYHDWVGSVWFIFAFIVGIYSFIEGVNPLYSIALIGIIPLFNVMDNSELKRQKEYIEQIIINCEKQ